MSTSSNGVWLRVGLLAPQELLRRSGGEVLRVESRDAATGAPMEGGPRCPRIFGAPGSAERRERFGHIQLAVPVVHPRFLAMRPSPLALLLGLRAGVVERLARRDVALLELELLARQLLGHVLIEEGSDTGLPPGQRVPWGVVRRLDAQALSRGARAATWTPVFTGLHTLAQDGGPLKGALFGDGAVSWARAVLSGQGEPSSSPLLRILAGLPPR